VWEAAARSWPPSRTSAWEPATMEAVERELVCVRERASVCDVREICVRESVSRSVEVP
jgi:hypothetical protein